MAGWQPSRCATCGHVAAEHKSSGSRQLGRVTRGVCMAPGCPCREFTDHHDENQENR